MPLERNSATLRSNVVNIDSIISFEKGCLEMKCSLKVCWFVPSSSGFPDVSQRLLIPDFGPTFFVSFEIRKNYSKIRIDWLFGTAGWILSLNLNRVPLIIATLHTAQGATIHWVVKGTLRDAAECIARGASDWERQLSPDIWHKVPNVYFLVLICAMRPQLSHHI